MSHYKPYPEYKDSGVEWIGEVPAHWEVRKVAWDLPFVVGWTPPTQNSDYYSGDIPWVSISDMGEYVITDTKTKITRKAVLDRKADIVPAGSLLFSFKLSVGTVSFLGMDAYTNEAVAAFKPTPSFHMSFWYYAAPQIVPLFGRYNIYGSLLLNQDLINSAKFFAPRLAEQSQIAAFLDRETTRIDTLIEKKQRFIELLEEKRQAVITHAVTKGLDPDVPMKDSGVEWIGEVPAHWEVVPGKALFIEKKRKNTDLAVGNYLSLVAGRGVIPYEEKGDIGNRKPDDLDRCKIVEPGDHVINSMNFSIGAYGRSRFSGVCSPVYVILGENDRRLGEGFGELILSNPFYQDFIQSFGSGILDHRRSIGWDEIKVAHVPCPPIQEQEEISALVHRETNRIDSLVDKTRESIELLKERRAALITAAVTGKIDVREEAA